MRSEAPAGVIEPERARPLHACRGACVDGLLRTTPRTVIALAFGVVVAYVVWRHIGTRLSVTTDIVGSTTFTDFDSYRYIYRFYDVTLVLPAATALLYMVLSRFGPLRADPPNRWPPQLEELEPTLGDVHESELTLGESGHTVGQDLLWALTRVALVALTVGIEETWRVGSSHRAYAIRSGCGNPLCNRGRLCDRGAAALAEAHLAGQRPRARVNTKSAWTYRSFLLDLSVVNAFASVVVIPLLVLVSSSTTVTIAGNGTVVHYTWFPAWLGALTTTVVVILLIFAHLHARFSVAPQHRATDAPCHRCANPHLPGHCESCWSSGRVSGI